MDQAARVVALVREVLGDDVIGAYLHGSSVTGGLHHASDIDILVVLRAPTSPQERRTLIERLLVISGRGDPSGRSRSVDLAMVVQSAVRPWRYPPPFDFQYGDWLRSRFEQGDLAPWESPSPDLAIQIEMARQADHPLVGPRPATVLDAIPPGDLRRALVDAIPALLADLDGDEANVVLTFARIWTTLAEGTFRAKDEAATWALPRLPAAHRAVLRHARAIYLGHAADDWEALRPRVRPHVDRVLEEIRHLADGG